jgi:hypothetical protein
MSDATVISPQNGRIESAVVATVFCAVVAVTVLYALTRPDQPAPLPLLEWQVSSFSDLTAEDQAIHSALFAAIGEIDWYYYRLQTWPDIPELEEDVLPPFYKDAFWEKNGALQWTMGRPLNNDQGATYYHGAGGVVPGQGSYLLLMGHIHAGMLYSNQNTIWIHDDVNAPYPEIVRRGSLIRAGWKQVITYSGADELERLRGAGS